MVAAETANAGELQHRSRMMVRSIWKPRTDSKARTHSYYVYWLFVFAAVWIGLAGEGEGVDAARGLIV